VCGFVCTGSEANDLALRIAQARSGSRNIIVVDWAYHGHLSSLIEISPYKYKRRGGRASPLTSGRRHCRTPTGPADLGPWIHRRALRGVGSGAIARDRGDWRSPRRVHRGIGTERWWQIMLPDGYLSAVYKDVRAAGGVTIADEVQVGFGRIGTHLWPSRRKQ